MKRQLLRFTAAAGILLAASAATANAQGFGVTAGATFSKIGGDDVANAESKTGFAGGVFYEFQAGQALIIRPELLYIMKGSGASGTDETLSLDYIQLPILVKYKFGSGKAKPFLMIGPAFGMNVNCDSFGTDCSDDSDLNKTEVSGVFGGGVQYNAFDLNVRYDMAFTDFADGADAKNQTWVIMLGYNFTTPR
jgi:Outer membrane protein beta-barrel domain